MKDEQIKDFEALFRANNKKLCDMAFNIVADTDAAKDIVQEVFIALWNNKETISFGDQISHYLFKATAHRALNYLRSNKKLIHMEAAKAVLHGLTVSPNAEDVEFRELELRVREAIELLPDKCKAIYLLSRQEGLKYQEIAETLGLSVKTVENQMGIALEKLRGSLKPFLTLEIISLVISLSLCGDLPFF